MNRQIYIQTQFTGYHQWNEAPECVAFLRNAHRHIFHVKVTVPVKHNNRQIEFFMMKRALDNFISNEFVWSAESVNIGSCEMIAEKIAKWTYQYYVFNPLEDNQVIAEVSEDGECGAIYKHP